MRVLIIHASRYGSTADVAEAIADTLREGGHDVVVWAAREMPSPRPYDAVVVGSATRGGRVRGELQRYFAKYKADLGTKRIALFAVAGSLRDGTDESRHQTEAALRPLAEDVFRAAPGTLAGAIDPRGMPIPFRFFMRPAKSGSNDDQKWDEIRAWASGVSDDLTDEPRSSTRDAAASGPQHGSV